MIKNSINYYNDQEQRIKIKTLGQQMKNLAVQGTGISPWEAEVLIQSIEDVYFSESALKKAKPGQIKYQCISAIEGAGKPLKNCQMVTVVLTLFDETDKGNFTTSNNKDRSIELRRRRLARLTEEAKEQMGYLTQEDLSELLMCDVRTIRRDTKELKEVGIILPTRGQQKDIGPGISHRSIAIRHWLEGKEPTTVAQAIKHSVAAVENYLQKFQRVAYLRGKDFDKYEIAMTVGISLAAAMTFLEIYDEYKNKALFNERLEEINLIGGQYYQAQDEKKSLVVLKDSTNKDWRQP